MTKLLSLVRRGIQAAVLLMFLAVWLLALAAMWLPIVLYRAWRRRSGEGVRVLFGPTASINNIGFAASLRRVGWDAASYVYRADPINDAADFDKSFERAFQNWLLRPIVPYAVFAYVLARYDVFFFYFNVEGYLAPTPLRYVEYALIKAYGGKIVCMAYGSDVQRRERMSAGMQPFYPSGNAVGVVERNVAHSARWADFKVSGGELIRHMPYDISIHLLCVDLDTYRSAYPGLEPCRSVRIVHATGHRNLKGSDAIEAACRQLRAEGFDIDYVFVSGLRNREAREIYATADIIVDQLLLGCYGMFAVEGMALGKPVVSYLAADVIAANPTYPSCPIVIAEPHDITDRLRELVSSPELRRSLGERSRRYAEKFHSPSFTGRVLAAIALRVWLGKASADPRRLVDEAVAA